MIHFNIRLWLIFFSNATGTITIFRKIDVGSENWATTYAGCNKEKTKSMQKSPSARGLTGGF
jgi:hypothetical protein